MTHTTLQVACAQAIAGERLELIATVGHGSGGSLRGQVAFTDGALLLGSAPLVDGRATLAVQMRSTGPHRLKATFASPDFDGPSWDECVVAVRQRSTTTIQARLLSDGTMRLVAIVSATHLPSGEVTFHADGVVLATVPLSSGCAVLVARLADSTAHFTAAYDGDSHSLPSCST